MGITGNWMIDADSGDDPRSPYYQGDENQYCEECESLLDLTGRCDNCETETINEDEDES